MDMANFTSGSGGVLMNDEVSLRFHCTQSLFHCICNPVCLSKRQVFIDLKMQLNHFVLAGLPGTQSMDSENP